MDQSKSGGEYVKAYSTALLGLGLLLLLGAVQLRFVFPASPSDPSTIFVSDFLFLLGFSCLAVASLRWARAPQALPATAALSLFLLIAFPFGTIVAIYWLVSVRPQEKPPQDISRRTWFRYTVALYVLGLLLLDTALVFRLVLGSPGQLDRVLVWLEVGCLVVAAAAIAIAAARSTRLRGPHWATLVLNVLLALWFPVGTALALVWFFAVRKHEKQLIAEAWQPPAA